MDDFRKPQSANEAILQNILGADNVLRAPQSVIEELLIQISEMSGGSSDVLVPWLNGTITEIKAADLRGVSAIGFGAFESCSSLVAVSIPRSVTRIRSYAFARCVELKSITLHDGIETIESSAFYFCIALENFVFPPKIKNIYGNVLDDCQNLKYVEIPASVVFVQRGAFARCKKLETVICKAVNPPTAQDRVFENTNDTFRIYVPAESVDAYKSAAEWSNYADRIFAIEE